MTTKILCIDDEPNILDGYRRSLRRQFDIDTATGGAEGLRKLEADGPYAVVVTDMRMPGMDGVEVLKGAQELAPDTVRMMLTGNADQHTAAAAVNQGHVFRFLTKPCPPEELALALSAGVEQYRLITAEKELLEKTLGGTIRMLVEMLAMVNPEQFGSVQTTRQQMRNLAETLRVAGELEDDGETWALDLAALLAQIGTVAVPPMLVRKARQGTLLTEQETQAWQRVPEVGYKLLHNIPRLEPVAQIVRLHRKNYDGTGIPAGPESGTQLPQGARMLKVLLDLAELEAGKVSKAGALAILQRQTGRYDPVILAAVARSTGAAAPVKQKSVSAPFSLKHLTAGLVLAEDIETLDGRALLTAGRHLTDVLLEKIANYAALAGIKEPIMISVFPKD